VLVEDALLPPGHGYLNRETFEAIRAAAHDEALALDPVYSGRSMADLFHLVATGRIRPGERVLYLHTGGTPGVFGCIDEPEQAMARPEALPRVTGQLETAAGAQRA
jgi:1-aminocyclopropane-1-carboxylate deaminase/D-cysteine desulfhydrase-like pyridoxal-dependent ACC family enzyme